MDKKKKILLITHITITIVHLYILYDFTKQYKSSFGNEGIMLKIKALITKNNLDSKYINIFEEVFNIYSYFSHMYSIIICNFLNIMVGFLTIIGSIINICSIEYYYKRNTPSTCLFFFIFIFSIFQMSLGLGKKDKLNITNEELEQFGDLKLEIENSLKKIKEIAKLLEIYSYMVFIISIIYIIITFIIYFDSKNEEKKVILIPVVQNNPINYQIEMSYSSNNSNSSIETVDNLITGVNEENITKIN